MTALEKNFTTNMSIEDALNEELTNIIGQLVEHNSKGFGYKYNLAREIENTSNYNNFRLQYEKNFSRELESVMFLFFVPNKN